MFQLSKPQRRFIVETPDKGGNVVDYSGRLVYDGLSYWDHGLQPRTEPKCMHFSVCCVVLYRQRLYDELIPYLGRPTKAPQLQSLIYALRDTPKNKQLG